jgi:hypothetical protein
MESSENGSACFPPFPQILEIARRMVRKKKIMRGDSHITTATMTTGRNKILQTSPAKGDAF